MMKKIIAFLMAFTMCVGFSSCGESSTDKSNKEVTTEESTVKGVDFIEFYNNLEDKYAETFTDGQFYVFLKANESYLGFVMLSKELTDSFSLDELDAYSAIVDEVLQFMSENEQVLNSSTDETEEGRIMLFTKKEE